MELFASVKNGKGEIVEITSTDFSTKKDFKSYLHSKGFKVRFISKDTVTDIKLSYEKYEEKKATAKAKRKAKTEQVAKVIDYTLMSDNDLHDVVLSQLDFINRDLMETCVYNDLNGNGKYVHVSDNDFMDITPALAEYNRRFGTTEIFCLLYRHFESRKTHVEYDSFDDVMYIVEVIPYDEDGNIIEYGYYVGDYYVRYSGVTENIEIVEVNENETSNETKNEKEVKAKKKTNREFKVNNTTYSVVNNPNYNKEFAFEPSSMKYYAMKLLTTDNITKSWVKTGITGNSIAKVKEKVKEWEDFMKYVEHTENAEPVENTEPVNQEVKIMPKFKAVVKKHNGVDIECMGFIAFDDDITKASKKARKLFRQGYSGHYRKGDGYIEIFRQENGRYIYDTSCYL